MKKLILALAIAMLMTLASMSVISAQDLVFKQYQQVDLKVPCINNGTYCSSSTVCNLTITYPNSSMILDNVRMTNSRSYHNYTIGGNLLSIIGNYPTTMVCFDSVAMENGYSTFSIQITASGIGEEQDRVRTMWLYALAGIIFLTLVLFAWKTELGWMGFLGGVVMALPGIHLMVYGFGMYDQLLTRGIATVIIAIGALTMVIFSLEALSGESGEDKEEAGGEEEDYDYFKQ